MVTLDIQLEIVNAALPAYTLISSGPLCDIDQYTCQGSHQCIPRSYICDGGAADCHLRRDDELFCSSSRYHQQQVSKNHHLFLVIKY